MSSADSASRHQPTLLAYHSVDKSILHQPIRDHNLRIATQSAQRVQQLLTPVQHVPKVTSNLALLEVISRAQRASTRTAIGLRVPATIIAFVLPVSTFSHDQVLQNAGVASVDIQCFNSGPNR